MENNELKHILIYYKSNNIGLQQAHDEILRLFNVSRWQFLKDREDYKEIPKDQDFRCLFDDGTECNYSDDHPFAQMIAWKPIS